KAALVLAAVILLGVMTLTGGVGWTLQERAGRRARMAEAAGPALEESGGWQGESRQGGAVGGAGRAPGGPGRGGGGGAGRGASGGGGGRGRRDAAEAHPRENRPAVFGGGGRGRLRQGLSALRPRRGGAGGRAGGGPDPRRHGRRRVGERAVRVG